jgi:hypothetical protein
MVQITLGKAITYNNYGPRDTIQQNPLPTSSTIVTIMQNSLDHETATEELLANFCHTNNRVVLCCIEGGNTAVQLSDQEVIKFGPSASEK